MVAQELLGRNRVSTSLTELLSKAKRGRYYIHTFKSRAYGGIYTAQLAVTISQYFTNKTGWLAGNVSMLVTLNRRAKEEYGSKYYVQR